MTSGIGINRLRQILPRFSFRIPACERLLVGLSNYHTVRASSTGLALDEPVHDWASHFSDSCRVVAEAEAAGMLHSAGSTANVHRRPVTVRAGFRGDNFQEEPEDILDRSLAPQSVASELSADVAKRQRAPAPHRRFTEAGYFLAEPCKLYV